MDECPICEKEIAVYSYFSGGAGDYTAQFEYECEHCSAKLEVEVTADPVFHISQAEVFERSGQ